MTREDFLGRVRGALHREKGAPVEVPPALLTPLQAWDPEVLVAEFCEELELVGGHVYVVDTLEDARAGLEVLLNDLGAETFIRSSDAILDDVMSAVSIPKAQDPALADVGLTGAAFGVANTGTLVLTSDAGRKASLLPMTHIALLRVSQLVPTMAEALERHTFERGASDNLPSAWVQATGPSRTADIELTLTTGVHGPGVVHVILVR